MHPSTHMRSSNIQLGRRVLACALTLVLGGLAPRMPLAGAAAAAVQPAALTPLAHVEVAGTGPVPVVLIPGLACDWTVFRAFMERNKDRYTMYAVTLPGFGGSAAPPAAGEPTEDVWLGNAERAIAAMIAERKLDKPLIVGHSLGAHLALRLSSLGPEKIRGVVALDGMAAFPVSAPGTPTPPDQRRKMAGMMGQQMLAMPAENWVGQQKQWFGSMVKEPGRAAEIGEMAASVSRETTVRYMTELIAADATERVKAAKTPMLAIAAIPDAGAPGAEPEQMRAAWTQIAKDIPNLTVVYFENTRHFVMDDAPAEMDRAIADFVAGRPVVGKALEEKPAGAK
jgi:pimeloyl-ACP methyl ester carboxylesterase